MEDRKSTWIQTMKWLIPLIALLVGCFVGSELRKERIPRSYGDSPSIENLDEELAKLTGIWEAVDDSGIILKIDYHILTVLEHGKWDELHDFSAYLGYPQCFINDNSVYVLTLRDFDLENIEPVESGPFLTIGRESLNDDSPVDVIKFAKRR